MLLAGLLILIKFELLLCACRNAGQALRKQDCLRAAARLVCFHRSCQFPYIRLDVHELIGLCQPHKSAQAFAIHVLFTQASFFTQGRNQGFYNLVCLKYFFHDLAPVDEWNFLSCKYL